MNYTVSGLGTVEECDSMIQVAQEIKDELEFKKNSLEHRMQGYEERSVKVGTDLAAANAELSSLQSIFPTLPAGQVKDDVESRIKRLEYRQWLLAERSETYGAIALVEQQLEIGRIEAEVVEIDALIASVNTHKGTLT